MTKKVFAIWFLLLTLFFLSVTSCSSEATSVPLPTATPPGWITKWLEEPACPPPCWEGIVPGTSMTDSVQDVLHIYPNVSIIADNGASIIQVVILNLSLHDNLPVSLLISKIGQPDFVNFYKCDPNRRCVLHLIYADEGMVLDVYPENTGKFQKYVVVLSPDTSILKIYFFESGLDNYDDIFGSGICNKVSWVDYNTYSCP